MLLGDDAGETETDESCRKQDNGWNDILGHEGGGCVEFKVFAEGLAFARSRNMLSM